MQFSELHIPNPRLLHAEVEALRNLDIKKYPNLKEYTLYAGLEPCPMCVGTLAMSGLRKIIIATKDDVHNKRGVDAACAMVKDGFFVGKLASVFDKLGVPYVLGKVWTTDSMIRETKGLVAKRKAEGCIAVEVRL